MYKNLYAAPNGQEYKIYTTYNDMNGQADNIRRIEKLPINDWSLLGGFQFRPGFSKFNEHIGNRIFIHKIRIKFLIDTTFVSSREHCNRFRAILLVDKKASYARSWDMYYQGTWPINPENSDPLNQHWIGFVGRYFDILPDGRYDRVLDCSFQPTPGGILYYPVPPSTCDIDITNIPRYDVIMDWTGTTDNYNRQILFERELNFKTPIISTIKHAQVQVWPDGAVPEDTVYGTNIPWFGIVQDTNEDEIPWSASISVYYTD